MVQQHLQTGDYSTIVVTPNGVQIQSVATNATTQPTFRRRRYVPPVRDSQARISRIGRPGSRRYQRFLNNEYLIEQQWDLELEDFQVVRFGGTPFTPLFAEHNRKIWEPFIDVTEEEEQWMLRQLDGKPTEQGDELGDWIVIEKQTEICLEDFEEPTVHASTSMGRIQRNIRNFIRKNPDSPFLLAMDKEISDYVEHGRESLTYLFENAFQRMICHGICQYYALISRSEDQPDGTRLTTVSKPKKGVFSTSHTLSEYLQTFPVKIT